MKMFARELRKQMTEAEARLWYYLRARRFEGVKFRRQQVIEPYIVDFVCYEARLIIEADGGQHADKKPSDDDRTAFLNRLGYTVLRFWNDEILNDTDAVLERIHLELRNTPHPIPSP